MLHVYTFPGSLVLWDLGSSAEVSQAEFLKGLGLHELRSLEHHPPEWCLQLVSVVGAQGTVHFCWNGVDLLGGNCLKYGATFTSVTQRKLSSSFCWRCSLH